MVGEEMTNEINELKKSLEDAKNKESLAFAAFEAAEEAMEEAERALTKAEKKRDEIEKKLEEALKNDQ